jgi:uncharacterized protein (DUF983 family)
MVEWGSPKPLIVVRLHVALLESKGGETMKDEMDKKCDCGCSCCGTDAGSHHHHGGGKHTLFMIGILAIVYGVVTWMMAVYTWPAYIGWTVAGILLVLIGWIKKSMHKQHMMCCEGK